MLHTLLAEHQRQLLFLEKRWSTPLGSAIRSQTAVQDAAKTATILSGETPALELDWIAPTFAPTIVILDDDDDRIPEPPASENPPDSETLIAEDELETGDDAQIDDDNLVEAASATLSWTLPVSLSIRARCT